MYVEDRLYFNREVPWENAIILKGNKIFTLTGLNAGTKYRLRWQAPDAQYPDVEVATQPQSSRRTNPKVVVTKVNFDSFTLSFDHFAPEDYNHGYVALYKAIKNNRWQSQEGSLNTKDLPSITIKNLEPNTGYEARIGKIQLFIFQKNHFDEIFFCSHLRRFFNKKSRKIHGDYQYNHNQWLYA